MMARWVVAVLLVAGLGGCLSSGGGTNPNLLAPKLVMQPRPDGNVTLFVHGAFRDASYDWLSISVDNVTISNRTDAFSTEETVAVPGFFVEVTAATALQVYQSRARVDVDMTTERVRVSFLQENGWTEAKSYAYPFEHILEHPKVIN
ncbi:MAG: hypothetical protein WDA16_11485 [Candidatus Thermoplasmatota archaeon]